MSAMLIEASLQRQGSLLCLATTIDRSIYRSSKNPRFQMHEKPSREKHWTQRQPLFFALVLNPAHLLGLIIRNAHIHAHIKHSVDRFLSVELTCVPHPEIHPCNLESMSRRWYKSGFCCHPFRAWSGNEIIKRVWFARIFWVYQEGKALPTTCV
jgi:hypothetical protein